MTVSASQIASERIEIVTSCSLAIKFASSSRHSWKIERRNCTGVLTVSKQGGHC